MCAKHRNDCCLVRDELNRIAWGFEGRREEKNTRLSRNLVLARRDASVRTPLPPNLVEIDSILDF